MEYEENKCGYIAIVAISAIVLIGFLTFLPFIIVGGILLLIVAALLGAFGLATNYYDKNVKPKIDKFIYEDPKND